MSAPMFFVEPDLLELFRPPGRPCFSHFRSFQPRSRAGRGHRTVSIGCCQRHEGHRVCRAASELSTGLETHVSAPEDRVKVGLVPYSLRFLRTPQKLRNMSKEAGSSLATPLAPGPKLVPLHCANCVAAATVPSRFNLGAR